MEIAVINEKKVFHIISARAGSNIVKDKNICELGCRCNINVASETSYIDHVYISKDSGVISSIAKDNKVDAGKFRLTEFGTDAVDLIDIALNRLGLI